MKKIINRNFALKASCLMKWLTILTMAFMVLALALSFMGRETFTLRTPEGSWERAIYSEESHDRMSRGMTVSSKDSIHVVAKVETIPLSVHIALSAMFAIDIVPIMIAMYFLSTVFNNVSKGNIFTKKNAEALFLYGAITFIAAILSPFMKLGICSLVNSFGIARIDLSTGSDMFEKLIPAIGFMVASHIIKHGLSLQDEVDHTI